MTTKKYAFGRRSVNNLNQTSPQLQRICQRALGYSVMDFSVIEGHRDVATQRILYSQGKSQIDGVNKKSKHNHNPSKAVDLLPYPHKINGVNVWQDHQRFAVLAGLIMAAAAEEGVAIRWGGDWDGDGNNADSTLHDMPHFELTGVG